MRESLIKILKSILFKNQMYFETFDQKVKYVKIQLDILILSFVKNQKLMQISDIVSPTYSVNSNVLKLNSSSVAGSTPGYEPMEKQLVEFQEFSEVGFHLPPRGVIPKKRLTIDIDEINDFQQQECKKIDNMDEKQRLSKCVDQFEVRLSLPKGDKYVSENEIHLQQKMKSLTNKMKDYEKQAQQLRRQNEQLRLLLIKKDQSLEAKQNTVKQLTDKLAQYEKYAIQDQFYDQKLREKQIKYRELHKIHEKVVAMNKNLQKDLRESEKKIMDLEKEVQKNVCANQYENMIKVKESSIKLKESSLKVLNPTKENKQNNFSNTVKSLDKKKTVTQPKKTTRIATSTINFAKKLQIKNIAI